jgi:hypothetical protein
MTTMPRPRFLTIAVPILLLAGAVLRADDRFQRPHGGFGRIEGRPDREEVLRGARPYDSPRPLDTVGLRPYERREVTPPRAPAPRRTLTQYYPAMRSGQHAHCTPSRASLAGMR